MNEMTFDTFRKNVRLHYKTRIRESIEQNVISLIKKYECLPLTISNSNSYKNEMCYLLNSYIDSGMDENIIYEAYNDIISDYNNIKESTKSFVDESIQNCINKFGYPL